MPTLTFSRLRKSYATTVAVDDVTFEVRSGEVFGLLGPNGAGKTSLIRILMDIIAADAGEILLDGRPVGRADLDRIGYLPEERGLYRKERVLEVLVYFGMLKGLERAAARERARRWLERVDLPAAAGRRVDELSKGMQQKVQIAGALLHDPRLIVLDPESRPRDLMRSLLERGLAPDHFEVARTPLEEIFVATVRGPAARAAAGARAGEGGQA